MILSAIKQIKYFVIAREVRPRQPPEVAVSLKKIPTWNHDNVMRLPRRRAPRNDVVLNLNTNNDQLSGITP